MLKLHTKNIEAINGSDLKSGLIVRLSKNPNSPKIIRAKEIFIIEGNYDSIPEGFLGPFQ